MYVPSMSALFSSVLLFGCAAQEGPVSTQAAEGDATPADASRTHPPQTHVSPTSATSGANDPAAFLPQGATLVDTVHGDLTGRGTSDALIVFSPATPDTQPLGEGPARMVVLLTRDASGQLRKAAENARIVPCERCGGMTGDPYAYARIEAGTVTLAVAGGSRERWFSVYVFRYAPERATWQLEQVVRGVTDTQTGAQKQAELTVADFGEIGFSDFDPQTLPTAPTLH
ncbi:conserved hypothetical protein [Luteimonas sp. 9C]|uniref:hypothetical protein n=1 Tax=Luteimonas sp. 9C TaxID=2653148 RepID=UPI0012F28374|nr:hypothetical protein [Luteimonas sp. 9C]VXB13194.1 conserved hypothetical protein [Luteimonas sp. 9C]